VSARRLSLGDKPTTNPVAESWIRQGAQNGGVAAGNPLTARLTIDVTPSLRGRIKIIAFERGVTVAEMLRDLLEREYSNRSEST
jgi:hypothetical protein